VKLKSETPSLTAALFKKYFQRKAFCCPWTFAEKGKKNLMDITGWIIFLNGPSSSGKQQLAGRFKNAG